MTRGFSWLHTPYFAVSSHINDITKLLASTQNLVPMISELPTVIYIYSMAMGQIPLCYHSKSTEIKLVQFIHSLGVIQQNLHST